MELKAINTIRERYRSLLSGDDRYNEILIKLVEKPETEPILSVKETEAEGDLHYHEEQRQMSEILLDMYAVNNGMQETKNRIQNTISLLDTGLDNILSSVHKQKEQSKDINMICGKESEFSSVIPVPVSVFRENSAEVLNDKTFGAAAYNIKNIPYDIVSITGNGYSGNAFVYNDGTFENEVDDRSVVQYIFDSNETTVYEYSRLSTKDKTEAIGGVINYDDKEVECIITLALRSKANKAMIRSGDKGLIVRKIEISQDGFTYTTCSDTDLYINKTEASYLDHDYVYGSSVLCFPYASYVRFTLASNTICNDSIAIENEIGAIVSVNAYRKKIELREISLYSADYQQSIVLADNILEDSTVDKVALFASEYLPDHFPDNEYISYYIIVNGKEYPVVPINSGKNGTIVIRYAEGEERSDDTTELIHETIKTIGLKVIVEPFNGKETPYVSNIKLCIGKNTGNIYV